MKKNKQSKKDKNFQNRYSSRMLVVEALYQYGFNNVCKEDLLVLKWFGARNMPNPLTIDYYQKLLNGIFDQLTVIDEAIKEFTIKDESRMLPIDKAILRFAIYSLIYEKDVTHIVIINEAIKLSKQYSGVDAHKFINGVLDSVYKKRIHSDHSVSEK